MKHRLISYAPGFVLIAIATTFAGSAHGQDGERFTEDGLYPGGLKSINDIVDCSNDSSYCDSATDFLNLTTEGSFGPTGWGAVTFEPNGIIGTTHMLTGHDVSWCYVVVGCSDGSYPDDSEMGTLLNGVGAPTGEGESNSATDCFASCPPGVQATFVISQIAIVRSQ